MECACEQTESLRGAAVNAYLTRFLERVNEAPDQTYQCRICGARWLRQERDAHQPAQLLHLAKGAFSEKNEEEYGTANQTKP